MQKYASVSRDVKQLMLETTPLVEPLSLDEAFLDLTGTERLHKCTPAQTLARLAKRIEDELRITVSIGLSFNKFLAKVASDLDKPRGFSVIGRAEAVDFLDKRPVTLLPGVGKAFAQSLARDGIFTIGDVRRRKPKELGAHFGASGLWLWRLVERRRHAHRRTARAGQGHLRRNDVRTRHRRPERARRILWSL